MQTVIVNLDVRNSKGANRSLGEPSTIYLIVEVGCIFILSLELVMAPEGQSVTLDLDLRPNSDQVGELHGQAPSKPVHNFLAISPPKSLFHYQITSGLEIHGLYNGELATLVTFKAHFQPGRQARPIKRATITAYFESEARDTDEPIRVEAFALGQPTVKVNCSVESDTLRKSTRGNLGVDEYASAGINASRDHDVGKEKTYAATVSGFAYSSEVGGDTADTTRWILEGNVSQDSAIPPDITFGVILLRADDSDFVGTVKVEIQVDWRHTVESWCAPFKSYKKWGNVARHKVYSPKKSNEDRLSNKLEIGHLETLTENSMALMKTLVKIEMPEIYKYEE